MPLIIHLFQKIDYKKGLYEKIIFSSSCTMRQQYEQK